MKAFYNRMRRAPDPGPHGEPFVNHFLHSTRRDLRGRVVVHLFTTWDLASAGSVRWVPCLQTRGWCC